ncbi:hypothetical protein [Actinomadura kijaniata]|uniref:hypothetical protein n=1 Tax=Actinomadura kijaniata TaxID=46161 RepID=UPI000832BE41|nr:hypothetical protein [Actinomadura kijaniata]
MSLNSALLSGVRPIDRSPEPDGLALALQAFRAQRHQAAITDTAALTRKLAELNITPISTGDPTDHDDPDDSADGLDESARADLAAGLVGDPMHIEADGTVSTLIAMPAWATGPDGTATATGRYVWACARQGWLWLRASDATGQGLGDAGPLETLADVGRALTQGPTHTLYGHPLPQGAAARHYPLLEEAVASHGGGPLELAALVTW